MRLGEVTLGELPPDALIEGFRINPRLESVFSVRADLKRTARSRRGELDFSDQPIPVDTA